MISFSVVYELDFVLSAEAPEFVPSFHKPPVIANELAGNIGPPLIHHQGIPLHQQPLQHSQMPHPSTSGMFKLINHEIQVKWLWQMKKARCETEIFALKKLYHVTQTQVKIYTVWKHQKHVPKSFQSLNGLFFFAFCADSMKYNQFNRLLENNNERPIQIGSPLRRSKE